MELKEGVTVTRHCTWRKCHLSLSVTGVREYVLINHLPLPALLNLYISAIYTMTLPTWTSKGVIELVEKNEPVLNAPWSYRGFGLSASLWVIS